MDATRGRKTDHDLEMEERQWLGFGKFLLLLGMAALFFVLAQSMVDSNFFSGEMNPHQATLGS